MLPTRPCCKKCYKKFGAVLYKQEKVLRIPRNLAIIRRTFGATDPIRTDDLLITSELLYRLSHSSRPMFCNVMYSIIKAGECQDRNLFFCANFLKSLHLPAQIQHPRCGTADGKQEKQCADELADQAPGSGGVKRRSEGAALDLSTDLQRQRAERHRQPAASAVGSPDAAE